MSGMPEDLLAQVLDGTSGPFALLHRPESGGGDAIDVLVGEVSTPAALSDISLPESDADRTGARHEVLAVLPYRQITERGFTAPDDGAPLVALSVTGQQRLAPADLLPRIPQVPTPLTGAHFDVDDADYAQRVRRVVDEVIGTGEGANFVLKRSFVAHIDGFGPHSALAFFSRLMRLEAGAYWTFLIHTGERTLVGASPERHVSLRAGTAVMNPVSGTYRYPPSGPTLPELMAFLDDRKEADELYMVVDEELKMMARICESGGRVHGPYLKEMARLAHTEYVIEGRTGRDVREILRETMFAPTVTGSPLESACRVIASYEPDGRGYYSGAAALIGRDEDGERALDSAILIRTADIDASGRVEIGVGATLVRHSDPVQEAAETRAKAAGLVAALEAGRTGTFAAHPDVRARLARRNEELSAFWLGGPDAGPAAAAGPTGHRVLVVDAEDSFTAMIAGQLRSLGLEVELRRFDEAYSFDDHDLVVMGPGPGDPGHAEDPRIGHLHTAVGTLLAGRQPFLAVCLSHQVLALTLGLELRRLPRPRQGLQKEIDFFGERRRVGFYNTFAAHSPEDKKEVDGLGVVEINRDAASGEVYGLRGPHFMSMQFHAESLLTQHGPDILADAVRNVLGA
ncbi:anthranilate synthase family protein [Streptomyces sp. CS7]|nr:anthranilate synthase family protein [Streptomyces sp. CS-7]